MKSPFKFLNSYTLEDKEVFFGRDKEIDQLYQMVFQTPLCLVYGLSGTGKTSLLQCGLAGRFDGPDWYPIWIRRQDNLNESIRMVLAEAIGAKRVGKLTTAVSYLFRRYLSPVYLIFDQFEELFILGSAEEQIKFIEDIQALLAADLSCRIIFVMREEYIGQLYSFEQYVPTLFDFRLRVERMNNARVKEVMQASFEKFNIAVNPRDALSQKMIDNISAGKSGIDLPYLQVYLDMLYREDYQRTYPGQDRAEGELPTLEFTEEEIDSFGQIDDVLDRFLQEQEASIQQTLSQRYPGLAADTVAQVLDKFVTEDGTKKPHKFELKEQGEHAIKKVLYQFFEYKLNETSGQREKVETDALFPPIQAEALSDCLQALEQSRILRAEDEQIELAHDSLALLIDQKRSDEQRQKNEAQKLLRNTYQAAISLNPIRFFEKNELAYFDYSIKKFELVVKPEINSHIDASQQEVERLERLELERQKKELRRQRIFTRVILAAALVAFGLGIFAFAQVQKNQRQQDENEVRTLVQSAKTNKVQGNYEVALVYLEQAITKSRTSGFESDSIEAFKVSYELVQSYMRDADKLANSDKVGDWKEAFNAYHQAQAESEDQFINDRLKRLLDKKNRETARLEDWAKALGNDGRSEQVGQVNDLLALLKEIE